MQPERWVSKAPSSAELIGITRRLLWVFGVPNLPSEYVSETSILPRKKSRRSHLSARISPILIRASTAVTKVGRYSAHYRRRPRRSCQQERASCRRCFPASCAAAGQGPQLDGAGKVRFRVQEITR